MFSDFAMLLFAQIFRLTTFHVFSKSGPYIRQKYALGGKLLRSPECAPFFQQDVIQNKFDFRRLEKS
jgi:hypothetical protein